jgi:hypothetical protein
MDFCFLTPTTMAVLSNGVVSIFSFRSGGGDRQVTQLKTIQVQEVVGAYITTHQVVRVSDTSFWVVNYSGSLTRWDVEGNLQHRFECDSPWKAAVFDHDPDHVYVLSVLIGDATARSVGKYTSSGVLVWSKHLEDCIPGTLSAVLLPDGRHVLVAFTIRADKMMTLDLDGNILSCIDLAIPIYPERTGGMHCQYDPVSGHLYVATMTAVTVWSLAGALIRHRPHAAWDVASFCLDPNSDDMHFLEHAFHVRVCKI